MSETMDVVSSLLKISRELSEVDPISDPEGVKEFLIAASWLVEYIANALQVELDLAAARGRMLAMKQLEQAPGPNGVRQFEIISGDDI